MKNTNNIFLEDKLEETNQQSKNIKKGSSYEKLKNAGLKPKSKVKIDKESLKNKLKNVGSQMLTGLLLLLFFVGGSGYILYPKKNEGILFLKKVKNLSSKRADIEVLDISIKQAQSEVSFFDGLKINSEELDEKEALIDENIPIYNKNTPSIQKARLYQLIENFDLEHGTITFGKEERSVDKIQEFYQKFQKKGLPNIYTKTKNYSIWFHKFKTTVTGTEKDIFNFMEHIQSQRKDFMFDAFDITNNKEKGIKLDAHFLALYHIKK